MVIVKVVMLGSAVKEYEISEDPKVSGLVNIMEECDEDGNVFNGTFTRDGNTLNENSLLHDGDKLYYSEKLKGNQLSVKVIRIGAAIQTYAVEPGATIKDVLDMLPDNDQSDIFNSNGECVYELRIGDSQPMDVNAIIPGGHGGEVRLILSKRIKGND